MRQALAIAALFLLGAPAAGWLLSVLGCVGAEPIFGAFCGHNGYIPLFGFTVAAWLVLVVAIAVRAGRRT